MKNAPRKLTLTRETLLLLHDHELGGIHGGTWATAIQVSARICEGVAENAPKASAVRCTQIAAAVAATAKGAAHKVNGILGDVGHAFKTLVRWR